MCRSTDNTDPFLFPREELSLAIDIITQVSFRAFCWLVIINRKSIYLTSRSVVSSCADKAISPRVLARIKKALSNHKY